MRRIVRASMMTLALVLASVGAVAASPSSHANCIRQNATAATPGTLGPSESTFARELGGVGQFVGGRGSGAAPTNTCDV